MQASGTLHFQGQDYPVQVQGLTVGEVGGGTITATGDVYNLGTLAPQSGDSSSRAVAGNFSETTTAREVDDE